MHTPAFSLATDVVLALNVLWFGAGAICFGLTTNAAATLLVRWPARQSPLFPTIAASVRFLGGLNFAFAVLGGVLLFDRALFPEPAQLAVLMSVIALAHGTQFAANVPVAFSRNSQGQPHWPVLKGPMLLIFVVDFALMLANGVLAACLLAA